MDFNLTSNWWVSLLQKIEFAVLVLGFEKLGLGLDNCGRTTKNAYCRIYILWGILGPFIRNACTCAGSTRRGEPSGVTLPQAADGAMRPSGSRISPKARMVNPHWALHPASNPQRSFPNLLRFSRNWSSPNEVIRCCCGPSSSIEIKNPILFDWEVINWDIFYWNCTCISL